MAKGPHSLVLGTAGHIDHGKTTLVGALTGVQTDRLPEEQRRGITIELGFAAFEMAADLRASIIDVPGHESFVRTMVAGAGGIDIVILVVSAEDGVMPQTREHLNVCRLLGIQRGVVALTKVDRLDGDQEAIELAVQDVRAALADSVFAESTIMPCSGRSGEGLEALRNELKRLATTVPRRDHRGPLILPVDRVFTKKGYGTVVTGTLLSGEIDLATDNHLRLVHGGMGRTPRPIRSRGAQVRHADQTRIVAGNRVALNLANTEVAEIHRGDVLTRGHSVEPRTIVHAMLQHLPGRDPPWVRGTSVQLCAGTAHTPARLDPLWTAPHPHQESLAHHEAIIPPGHQGLVRIRLEHPLPLWRDLRVIIRGFSSSIAAGAYDDQGLTVGGGVIVDPRPSSGRGQRMRWIAVGQALADSNPTTRVLALVRDAGISGIESSEIGLRAGLRDPQPRLRSMSEGQRAGIIALDHSYYAHREMIEPLVAQLITEVDRFHAKNPMQLGMARAQAEASVGPLVAPPVAQWVLKQAIARGALQVVDDQGALARPGQGVPADGALPKHMQRILDQYEQAGLGAPRLKDLETEYALSRRQLLEIVGVLQRSGRLVKLTPEISISRAAHDTVERQVQDHLKQQGTIDVQALKELTGVSRKYAVPLLELFDQQGLTRRDANIRRPGPRFKK